jgi:hypothetical protein
MTFVLLPNARAIDSSSLINAELVKLLAHGETLMEKRDE